MTTNEVILDSDFGTDDAVALLVALKHPNTKLRAITVVHGNVPLQQAVKNAKTIIAVANTKSIPIYAGCESPILENLDERRYWDGHGTDGLGDATAELEQISLKGDSSYQISEEHAVTALIRLVKEKPNFYTIIAIGPLTNVALAIRLYPNFLAKVKSLVIMGGCLYGKGNSSSTAEFNFHCDPEAASIVFEASGALPKSPSPKLLVVVWEVCVEYTFSWEFYDKLLVEPLTTFGKFLKSINNTMVRLYRATSKLASSQQDLIKVGDGHPNEGGFMPCDAYAVIAALEPSAVTKYHDYYGSIETTGRLTRGMVAIDWEKYYKTKQPNFRAVLDFDKAKLESILLAMVR